MSEEIRAPIPSRELDRLTLRIVEDDLRRIAGLDLSRVPHLRQRWTQAWEFVAAEWRRLDAGTGAAVPSDPVRHRPPDAAPTPADGWWRPDTAGHQGSESLVGWLIREGRQLLGDLLAEPETAPAPAPPGARHGPLGPDRRPEPWAPTGPVPAGTSYGVAHGVSPFDGAPMSELEEGLLRSQVSRRVDLLLERSPALRELYEQVDLLTVSDFYKGRTGRYEMRPVGADRGPTRPTVADVAAFASPGGAEPTPATGRRPASSTADVAAARLPAVASLAVPPTARTEAGRGSPVSRRANPATTSRHGPAGGSGVRPGGPR